MSALECLQVISSYAIQIVVVMSMARCLESKVESSRAKSRVWTSCFVSLLLLFVAGIVLPKLQLIHPWMTIADDRLLRLVETLNVAARILLGVWLGGLTIVALRWIWKFRQLQAFIASTPELTVVQQAEVLSVMDPELAKIGGCEVRFRISPEHWGPFCYQFHSPYVFLPASLLSGNVAELQHVLRHELTHLKTWHPMQLFIQKTVQTLFWFHPLVWTFGRRANLIREFVCDDAAATNVASTTSYLRTLLKIVENPHYPQGGTLAIGRSECELKQRVKRLVAISSQPARRQCRWAIPVQFGSVLLISQFWLPINPLSTAQAVWSPWPRWTAAVLHTFDISVRDYDPFESRLRLHELREDVAEKESQQLESSNVASPLRLNKHISRNALALDLD